METNKHIYPRAVYMCVHEAWNIIFIHIYDYDYTPYYTCVCVYVRVCAYKYIFAQLYYGDRTYAKLFFRLIIIPMFLPRIFYIIS